MLVSFILTALGAIENVLVAKNVHHMGEQKAERIDSACRWIAVPLYVVCTLWCAAGYGVSIPPALIIALGVCAVAYAAAAIAVFRIIDRRNS